MIFLRLTHRCDFEEKFFIETSVLGALDRGMSYICYNE